MLHEIRCEKCGALLCKEEIEIGDVEIKCYRCNFLNIFTYTSKILRDLFSADTI